MSYVVALSALGFALAVGAAISMMIWWVRRPPSGGRAAHEALPLFSHSQAALWSRGEDDDGDMPTIIASRTRRTAADDAPTWAPPPSAAERSTTSETHAVEFGVPTDSTLQFLAGWLEVVGGAGAGREVRFVRMPGGGPVEITFGRDEGALYRHVQLPDATVSRLHARLSLREGAWWLDNRSTTNPVMHNGRPLACDEAQKLEDGDRIDMGQVVFRFHA